MTDLTKNTHTDAVVSTLTTIDWTQFVVEVDGMRGLSLRALVDIGGLYSHMHHAVSALKGSGLNFAEFAAKLSEGAGRPSTDYLLTLRDAQRFCARARTDVGERVLDTILDHHDAIQRLINLGVPVQPTRMEVVLTEALARISDLERRIALQEDAAKVPARKRLMSEPEPVTAFLGQAVCFEPGRSGNKSVRMSQVYKQYKTWCAAAHASPLSRPAFGVRVKAHYTVVYANNQEVLLGARAI